MFEYSKVANGYTNFLNSKLNGNRYTYKYEAGFTFLVYMISIIFQNIHILMFFIEALIVFPVYFGCKKIKYLKNKIWLCMLVYYLLFFNVGLNTMREFIGLSFSFYGVCCILSKERKGILKYIIASITAFLFHKSTILSTTIVLVYFILNNNKKNIKYIAVKNFKISFNKIKALVIIAMGFLLLFNMNIFNSILYSNEGFSRYTVYYNGNISFSIFSIIRIAPILILGIVLLKRFIKKFENSVFYITMFCFAYLIFGQLGSASLYGDRISNIYKIISVITFPLLSITPNTKNGRLISTCIVITYALYYWWFMYAYRGYAHTVPFILGI